MKGEMTESPKVKNSIPDEGGQEKCRSEEE